MLRFSSLGGAEDQRLTWDVYFTKTALFHGLKYPPSFFFAFCWNVINTDDKQ